jgi:hypothetical protein
VAEVSTLLHSLPGHAAKNAYIFLVPRVIHYLEKLLKRGKLLVEGSRASLEEGFMRKWYVPLTVAGLGGLGAFLLTETGRKLLRSSRNYLRWHAPGLQQWNNAADDELRRIEATLAALARALQPPPQPLL